MIFNDYLEKYGIYCKTDFPTASISSIKAGGASAYALYPKNKEELLLCIRLCKSFAVPYKIIGGCTNTFVQDAGYSGALILTKHLSKINCAENLFTADAGVPLCALLRTACSCGYELRSELFGIPGSVGGAIRNNAGAFGAEISDIFENGAFYDANSDEILNLNSNEIRFAYRYSALQDSNLVFLSGNFSAKACEKEKITEKFVEFSRKRRDSQPNGASLGSFFKRKDGIIPAQLIDSAGLKGKRIGGAEISTKHAGFIINCGKATATDIDLLAKEAEYAVLQKYNLKLVREAELIN